MLYVQSVACTYMFDIFYFVTSTIIRNKVGTSIFKSDISDLQIIYAIHAINVDEDYLMNYFSPT